MSIGLLVFYIFKDVPVKDISQPLVFKR